MTIDFQEGFTGDDLEIRAGHHVVARLNPRTRLQTGWAGRSEIAADPGDTLVIALPDTGLETRFAVPADARYILVNRDEHGLRITNTEDEPGYL
ncbi:hypothetical protein [Sandarakinorhabdus oryzae]|uniref:hypothetical protein n=1 Tax=Sandarakinorhabdus oryzae TaxID=2675220 RepID=UPI0012E278D3|nr:hypothetical protein [Sandarakinorhabdus oryzae]